MAHQLYTNPLTGKTSMAYVGEPPWHGLGQQLTPESSREEWLIESGMDFNIAAKPVLFYVPESDIVIPYPNRVALYRDDTNAPLALVSDKFRVVQPSQIMEQQFNICDALGATMETAGVLFDGKRFWSMSRLGNNLVWGEDLLEDFVLIATACDGTMATIIRRTMVRVVCNNTLTMATATGSKYELRVPHQMDVEFDKVRVALGIDDAGALVSLQQTIKSMSEYHIDGDEALGYIVSVLHGVEVNQDTIAEALPEPTDELSEETPCGSIEKLKESKIVKEIYTLWDGAGKGSTMDTADHTLWGCLSAITEYQDHHRASKSIDHRLNRMWFGDGEVIKNRAYKLASEMVGA